MPETTPTARTTTTERAPVGAAAPPRPRHLVTANLFGIPFGLAGLAQCWATAADLVGAPGWPVALLWILTAGVYLVILPAYVSNVLRTGRAATEVGDLTFGPFTALILIIPMMGGLALAGPAPAAGRAMFLTCLTLVALYGGWLSSRWIQEGRPLERWHPGYYLPTVAGPLIGAAGSAALGYDGLARLMFGYGLVCSVMLGSIILLRLFSQPFLPPPLVPTIAIEMAPPVVAGNAWFLINGNRPDNLAYLLAGYAVLMVLIQLGLIPLYARLPFAAGVWAFFFSSAAVVTVSIRWLAAAEVAPQRALTYGLLTVITTALLALTVRTVVGLLRGTFLLRVPPSTP